MIKRKRSKQQNQNDGIIRNVTADFLYLLLLSQCLRLRKDNALYSEHSAFQIVQVGESCTSMAQGSIHSSDLLHISAPQSALSSRSVHMEERLSSALHVVSTRVIIGTGNWSSRRK